MKNIIKDYSSTQKTKASALLLFTISSFIILLIIGTINLYSAADSSTFWAQIRHICLSMTVFLGICFFLPARTINTYAYFLFIGLALLLFVVLFSGHVAGGSQRWINLGFIRFQPSEAAKVGIAVFVAKFFYDHRNLKSYYISDLWLLVLGVSVYFTLVFLQPDFGTAGMIALIAIAQLAFVKLIIGRKTLLIILALGLSSVFIGWNFLLRPYQKLRVMTLLNPNLDPMGSGYNSLQSLVAVGSGGAWGKGFLKGTQTQLQFLPARQTDFVFSVFAEEHGFIGATLVFILFAILSYCALEIARGAKNSFSILLAVGITALIFIEFLINVAMVLGVFPVVGMPLPFFSYGGSSLLTVCASMGILVAIERESRRS